MTRFVVKALGRLRWLVLLATLLVGALPGTCSSTENPLEPPDSSSPRATLTTFLGSTDSAWELYAAGNMGFARPFRDARGCLDLSEIPPLVLPEVSAETALVLKEILDRIALPPSHEIPDRTMVEELGLTRWTLPRTEIHLMRVAEGDR